MSSLEEIIVAKDLQIAELLAEIQALKDQLQTNGETLDNVEVTIDNPDISETVFLKYFDEEEEEEEEEEQQKTPNIMNLLNMFMGNGQESASNPFAEIMQKMMTPNEDGANPFSEIMQKMMAPDSSQ
jgi:regulator of replication initiation timing